MIDLFCDINDKNFEVYYKRNPDKRDFINNLFNESKKYLDSHFVREFKINTFDRLWELYILYILMHHDLNLETNKKEGPDFCIPHFIDEKPLYIECVCPNMAADGKEFVDGDYSIEIIKTPKGDYERESGSGSGLDHSLISRITSSIKDKSEKFDCYIKHGTVLEKSFKILCVNGYKVLNSLPKLNHCSWDAHLEAAIFGKEIIGFEKPNGEIFSYNEPISINKPNLKNGNKLVAGGNQKYLKNFDAIISSELCPFFGHSSAGINVIHLRKNLQFQEKLSRLFS